jgi:hypothetical protein
MSEIASASINSFAPVAQQNDFVPPSEQLIVLSVGQLQDLITQAIEKAIQPLKDEVSDLRATVTHQGEKIAVLESTQETQADNQLIQLRLINDLRATIKKDPQPLQKDRGEILRALIAANGGKMLAKDARKKMHLNKPRFSELMATIGDYIDTKPYHLNKSAKVLILKSST